MTAIPNETISLRTSVEVVTNEIYANVTKLLRNVNGKILELGTAATQAANALGILATALAREPNEHLTLSTGDGPPEV